MIVIEDEARSIFLAALEREPDQWAAYLDEACADNADVRARVNELLDAHQALGTIFGARGDATAIHEPPISEGPGTVIGPYKLLQQIGEGGMGVVFMAEQTEPIQRTVALKIIKPGMDTRQVIARFAAERQALAMMDHPNIAKVLDAGTTDSGRPYFVMELVKGVPVTKYCDENRLSLCQRLELFMPVCQAVQHAHQKGIIHRDIKPTNVLVAEYDNREVPKVIDFGVAKATAQKLTERTMFTEFGQVIGTVEYMSPEQAKLNQLDIDTRSDIYSLGVLLYELLVGSTPFGRERLREAAFDEVLRIIREEEPPNPSTRLSTSDTLPSIAANRHSEPARLSKDVRGELDWIVMCALEKDRNRRYQTASALAIDLQRYLTDQPVEACPPSASYRFRKFARRNRAALLTVVLVAAALILGTAVSTWQAIRAFRAEEQALTNEEEAISNAEQAEAVADFLVDAFRSPDPERDGNTITIAEVLQRAADELKDNLEEDPFTRAVLFKAIGTSYAGLGLYRESIPVLEETVRLFKEHNGPTHELTLISRNWLAEAYQNAGRLAEALPMFEETLSLCKLHLGPTNPTTLSTMNHLANAYHDAGRLTEAVSLYEETLRLRTEHLGPTHTDTLVSSHNLASFYAEAGDTAKAIPLLEQALPQLKEQLGPTNPDTLKTMNTLAGAYRNAGRRAEGLKLLEEALTLQKEKLGPTHADTLIGMSNLGLTYSDDGRLAEAATLLEEALQHFTEQFGPTDTRTLRTMNNLALTYQRAGRLADALSLQEKTWRVCKQQLGPTHPETLTNMNNLAMAYLKADRPAEGLPLLEKSVQLHKETLGATHLSTLMGMHNLANAYKDAGRLAEALTLFEETLALEQKHLGPTHPQTLNTMRWLSDAYSRAGRLDQAIETYEEAIKHDSDEHGVHLVFLAQLLSGRPASDNRRSQRAVEVASKATELSPQSFDAWRALGWARYRAGDWNGSIEALQKSLSMRPKDEEANSFDWFFLAMAHAQLGRQQEARKLYDDATAWMDKNLPDNEDLRFFRAEAAKLLGIPETKPGSGPAQPTEPPAKPEKPTTTPPPSTDSEPKTLKP